MTKGVKLTAAALLMATGAWAQAPADSLSLDNSDFTFTESQLDDDNDASQAVSTIVGAKSDPYNSEVGYLFSPMRFRVRGYDNMYSNYYINGLQLNDLELGRFGYSMIGGLNDATRNQEGVTAYDFNRFGVAGIGGATSVNARASQFAAGNKLTLSGCNRNYVARGMFTHATGLLPSGWAFAALVGYRWANEGVIEGTFYNSLSYFLSAEKRFGKKHALSRNSRVVNDFEPTAILTWDWKMNDKKKLTTAAGFKYSMYSSTALGWNGNAYDPRPDYYKNLPSSIFNVYDSDMNNPTFLNSPEGAWALEGWNKLYDHWTASKANRQIDWDRMYAVNRSAAEQGDETLYYQERRHNNQMVATFNTIFNQEINKHNKYALGLQYNFTKGMHYKTLADMLGGNSFTDYDKFAANEYGRDSQEAQNDLNNPNRKVGVDDKFGYNYNILVNKARAYGLYQLSGNHWQWNAQGFAEGTTMQREGLMKNGRAANNSFGKSGTAKFLGGGGRMGVNYRPNGAHTLALSIGAESNAPLARNSFVAPRMQNDFVNNLTNEDIYHADLSYTFRFGNFSGKVSGYYARFNNGVEQTAFYNDDESRFTYLTMTNVEREHYGVEAAFNYQITSNFSVKLVGTYGEAKYVNNPDAQVAYEGSNAATLQQLNSWTNPVTNKTEATPIFVLANGMRESGSPMGVVSLGFNYNVNGWFLSANLNYYDRVYIDFSEYRRLSKSEGVGKYTPKIDANGNATWDAKMEDLNAKGGIFYDAQGNIIDTYSAKQEKAKGGFMLDASIGKYIRLKKGKSVSINLSVQNITNNRNLKTGGYEQNRSDNYNTGNTKAYSFSKNSKYYYANAINGFLNIGFKF